MNDLDLFVSYVSNPAAVVSITNGTSHSLGDTPFEMVGIRVNAPVTIRISIAKVYVIALHLIVSWSPFNPILTLH